MEIVTGFFGIDPDFGIFPDTVTENLEQALRHEATLKANNVIVISGIGETFGDAWSALIAQVERL